MRRADGEVLIRGAEQLPGLPSYSATAVQQPNLAYSFTVKWDPPIHLAPFWPGMPNITETLYEHYMLRRAAWQCSGVAWAGLECGLPSQCTHVKDESAWCSCVAGKVRTS